MGQLFDRGRMNNSKPDRQLLKEAMDWMVSLSAAPADRRLHEAAETWRNSNPAHAAAWRQAERAWRAVAFARPDEPATSRDALPAGRLGAMPPRRRAYGMLAIASIVAVLALSLYVPSLGVGLRADHATSAAEHRRIDLQDGTVVELGAATALDVQFDERRRSTDLLTGEAFFSVSPGDPRPFVVLAHGVSILVTGTAFNVRVDDGAVAVAVEHGSVEVAAAGTTTPRPIHMRAGDQLVVKRQDGSFEQSTLPASEVASWRRYKLFIDGATVGDVVNELRRYDSGWIVVTDGNLLRQQVTGLYDLRDPAEALRVLVGPFGAKVSCVSPLLTIVSGS